MKTTLLFFSSFCIVGSALSKKKSSTKKLNKKQQQKKAKTKKQQITASTKYLLELSSIGDVNITCGAWLLRRKTSRKRRECPSLRLLHTSLLFGFSLRLKPLIFKTRQKRFGLWTEVWKAIDAKKSLCYQIWVGKRNPLIINCTFHKKDKSFPNVCGLLEMISTIL